MTNPKPDEPEYLTSREVAALFRVGVETVQRWAVDGRLTKVHRTPAGRLRFDAAEVRSFLPGGAQ